MRRRATAWLEPLATLVRPFFVSIEGRLAGVVGTPAIYAIAVSAIGASIYITLGIVADKALGPDAARIRRRGDLLRGDDADLRGGELAPPGAGRRVDLRPLRVRRAVELHRRLGDRPRLPDRDGAVRVRDPGLPLRVLGARRRRGSRARDRGRRDRVGGGREPARAARRPARARAPLRRAERPASCSRSSASAWRACGTGRRVTEEVELGVQPGVGRLRVRRRDRRARAHRARGGLGRRGRDPAEPQADVAGDRGQLGDRLPRADRRFARGAHGASGRGRRDRARRAVPGGAGAGRRVGLRLVRRHPAVRRRRGRRGRARPGGHREHDGRLAAVVLARHEQADPERDRPAAPAPVDAVGRDHGVRPDRVRARADLRPRLPRRHVRLRCDARVRDRARVGHQAALPRGDRPPPVPHAVLDQGRAAARCRCPPCSVS